MRTKEEKAQYSREWYAENRDRERVKRISYNKKYRRHIAGWEKTYRRTPAGFYAHVKKMALRRKLEFSLEKVWFLDWLSKQGNCCCYCKRVTEFSAKKETAPSIDRKDNLYGYVSTNIALCCARCNLIKNDFFSYEEMLVLGEAVRRIHDARN